MRSVPTTLTFGGSLVAFAMVASLSLRAVQAAPPDGISLLQSLAEWQYPDSKMLGGASMSDGGNPHVQSAKCAAVLTTPDPVEKVVAYYAEKFAVVEPAAPRPAKEDVKQADAKSVTVQDDSKGRPVAVCVFVVNKADTSTTLVISRAEGEKETHIAWSHYIRLGDGQAKAADDQVRFSLGIYSGREDPIWTASDDDVKAFTAKFDAMKAKNPQERLTGALGYHGFLVKGFRPYDRIWVWKGTVEATREGKTYQWVDEDRALERFLLEASRAHISDREYKMVADEVEKK